MDKGRPSKSDDKASGQGSQVLENDVNTVAFVVGILVGILTLIIIFKWMRGKKTRRTIALLGTCDSGKTTIFAKITQGKDVDTYTSVQKNTGTYNSPGKSPVTVVDVPGHERVRQKFVESIKSNTMGVVYVVDSSTLKSQLRDSTEFLFNLLSDPEFYSARIPIAIACNKQDIDSAKGSAIVQREMEKEITLLRETRAKSLQGTDNSTVRRVTLGKEGEDFSFAQLPSKVSFYETIATKEDGLKDLFEWLMKIS